MISIDALKPEDVGRWVAHVTDRETAFGRIKSWRNSQQAGTTLSPQLWVVYKPDGKWWKRSEIDEAGFTRTGDFMDYTGVGTDPADLFFFEPDKGCPDCCGMGYTVRVEPYGENAKFCICLLDVVNRLARRPYTPFHLDTYGRVR